MTEEGVRRLRMFAGPNGSGKTSLVRTLAREFSSEGLFYLRHYVNADDLLAGLLNGSGIPLGTVVPSISADGVRQLLTDAGRLDAGHPFLNAFRIESGRLTAPAEVCDSYAAAAVADYVREELLAAGQSFSFETVMSHRSKVEFFARARTAGYRTYLYFVATESAELNVERVQTRVVSGGHFVPEEKIVERYKRCLHLVKDAMAHAHRAFVFDNSGAKPVRLAQRMPDGVLEVAVPEKALPDWFRTWVIPQH